MAIQILVSGYDVSLLMLAGAFEEIAALEQDRAQLQQRIQAMGSGQSVPPGSQLAPAASHQTPRTTEAYGTLSGDGNLAENTNEAVSSADLATFYTPAATDLMAAWSPPERSMQSPSGPSVGALSTSNLYSNHQLVRTPRVSLVIPSRQLGSGELMFAQYTTRFGFGLPKGHN